MNMSALFIRRPVATSLLMLAVLLLGLMAYFRLPVSALPEVDYPTIQIKALYPGASPDLVTSAVTAPLERQLGQIAGLNQMYSISSGGASAITLQFGLDVSLDVAEQEVQAALNAASNLLPSDLPLPPVYSKVNPADAPILTLAVRADAVPLTQVNDWVETRLAMKISQIAGVGLVSIAGGRRPAVRIQVNTEALSRLGISLEQIRTAIGAANVNLSKGSFDGRVRSAAIDANDQLKSAREYADVVLAYKNGAPVRLSDVADVVDGAENARLAAWSNQDEAVIVNVQRQPGANVIDVADRVLAALPQLQASLPAALTVEVLADRTQTIRASVHDVKMELVLAVCLVIAVIFVFLRTWQATLIPSLAVPLSLVGTFALMWLSGFSINNLTLMALVIASGFVVDDAIVMIENIARYVEEGMQPLQAALHGAGQIGFTIVSLTVSLVAVLIPLLFMGDVVGRLFHEFALTLTYAILISALVSLTLTPMLCALLLKRQPHLASHTPATQGGFFGRWIQFYDSILQWVWRNQGVVLLLTLLTLVATVLLYVFIPKGFFPVQDTGQIQGVTVAPQQISFVAMAERQQAMVQSILNDPAVQSVASQIGVDGTNATLNTGRVQITLKPLGQGKANRSESAQTVLQRIQQQAASVQGISLTLQSVQDLSIEGQVGKTQYQLSLSAPQLALLSEWVPQLVKRLQALPQLQDVSSDLQDQGLQAYVNIDRITAGRLGVSVSSIDNTLYNAMGQRLISTIFTQSNQYRVILERQNRADDTPQTLANLYVPSSTGGLVPLSAFARIEERTAPLAIQHLGQFPASSVSFNLAPEVSLGEAIKRIEGELKTLGMPLAIQTEFQGAAKAFQASLSNTVWLIVAALVTMYIVLGVLYESYIHPVTILSTLPSAGVGALMALWVTGSGLDMIGIIGIVLLIGIVKKNAIMMIDFALDARRTQGLSAQDAIHQACLLRFRPILMTTLAALLGAVPLALGGGYGAELRQPLGYAMIGGLIVSQVLTLLTTPVVYLAFDRLFDRTPKAS